MASKSENKEEKDDSKKDTKKESKKGTTRKKLRNLVVVESPAKARTIGKYLGKGFNVMASMGHIRDLPQKRFGIDLENKFEPKYVNLGSKSAIIKDLSKAAKGAEQIYLATDLDREGEAIAWHLVQALKIPLNKVHRVTFNEITQKAIQEAFDHPAQINMDKVNAQQARRVLDRIMGYKLSPLLWKKITKGLSAGRVQSVAVRLIVEREKEIQSFKSEEYWDISAQLRHGAEPEFEAVLKKLNGTVVDESPYPITNESAAKELADDLAKQKFTVHNVETKTKLDNPAPPFITSTLQQQASIRLRFSSKKTMLIAQQLYEGLDVGTEGSVGLITYMRTDSTNIAGDALKELREFVPTIFGPEYVSEKVRSFSKAKRAQEAHECIRPTSATRTPANVKDYLSNDQYKLYKMIWDRFVACQMSPAKIENTLVDVEAGKAQFRASGKRILFDGYKKVWQTGSEDKDQALPHLEKGQTLEAGEITPEQHFTQPPPRYTEASLIRTLEKEGIGRPSTYSTIISTIQDRGYVRQTDRKFFASDLGMLVTEKLVEHFPRILNPEFTSQMENNLDEVENSKAGWKDVVQSFYDIFAVNLDHAAVNMKSEKEDGSETEIKCELCSQPMVVRWSRRGKFLGCKGYPDCRNVKPLDQEGKPADLETSEEKCDKCDRPMVSRTGPTGQFLACSGYPECRNTKSLGQDGAPLPTVEFPCRKCNAAMVVKYSRRGPFYACSAFPKCKFTVSMDKQGKPVEMEEIKETCDKCGSDMTLKWSPYRNSKFLACTGYPKCRNTKPFKREEAESK